MSTLAANDRVVHHSAALDLMSFESYRSKSCWREADGIALGRGT